MFGIQSGIEQGVLNCINTIAVLCKFAIDKWGKRLRNIIYIIVNYWPTWFCLGYKSRLVALIYCLSFNVIAYFFNLFGNDFGNFLYGAHYWVTSGLFIYLYSITKELPLHRKILYSSIGIAATVIIGIISLIFLFFNNF